MVITAAHESSPRPIQIAGGWCIADDSTEAKAECILNEEQGVGCKSCPFWTKELK